MDKIRLDPARAVVLGVMILIVKRSPERVVYIFCNPTSLAWDRKVLLEANYRLEYVQMLDMFPQTAHLESLALFVNTTRAVAAK